MDMCVYTYVDIYPGSNIVDNKNNNHYKDYADSGSSSDNTINIE